LRIGFSTLGCPAWDLDTVCSRGSEYGFDGVDFRGLGPALDITVLPEFTVDFEETREKLARAGLSVSGISSGLKICASDRLDENLDEARRTIPIAKALDVAAVRVFGGGDLEAHSRETLVDAGQRAMEAVLDLEGAREIQWVLETHDNWISTEDCRRLLDRIPDRAFGMLWDMGHTSRVGGEDPVDSLEVLGDRVRYLHVKDAVYDPDHPRAMEDGWRYVAPGMGQLPVAEALALLRDRGYDGWVVYESERRWQPEMPEPEEIFPEFVAWYRALSRGP
jgi:sugar phosphate isomerase/epimerase